MTEMGLHRIPVMRAGLERIRDLHRPVPIYTTEAGDCEHGYDCEGIEGGDGWIFCPDHTDGFTCGECARVAEASGEVDRHPSHPCATRRVADEALGGGGA